jgi:hypothetical protein
MCQSPSCCLNSLTMWALYGLALLSIKIGVLANWLLSKWGTVCPLSTLSQYVTPLRLPCYTWTSNLQLKEQHPEQLSGRHGTALYPLHSRHAMQCFHDTRFDRDHPRGAIKIESRLTYWLVSNFEYFNEDYHVTNSIEPTNDVMKVAIILWVALHAGLLIEPSVISPYRYMRP